VSTQWLLYQGGAYLDVPKRPTAAVRKQPVKTTDPSRGNKVAKSPSYPGVPSGRDVSAGSPTTLSRQQVNRGNQLTARPKDCYTPYVQAAMRLWMKDYHNVARDIRGQILSYVDRKEYVMRVRHGLGKLAYVKGDLKMTFLNGRIELPLDYDWDDTRPSKPPTENMERIERWIQKTAAGEKMKTALTSEERSLFQYPRVRLNTEIQRQTNLSTQIYYWQNLLKNYERRADNEISDTVARLTALGAVSHLHNSLTRIAHDTELLPQLIILEKALNTLTQ